MPPPRHRERTARLSSWQLLLCGYLLNSGHGRLVSTARPLPGTGNSVAVFAEFALVMVRRTHGTKPVRESVFTDLPRVLERVRTQIAEDVSFQVPALFVVADVLDASDLSAGVVEVELVKKESAITVSPSFGVALLRGGRWFSSLQPLCRHPGYWVDVDLPERRRPRVDELVRRPRRDDDDLSRRRLYSVLADGEAHLPFLDDERLLVRVPMQARPRAGTIAADKERDVCPVLVAVEPGGIFTAREPVDVDHVVTSIAGHRCPPNLVLSLISRATPGALLTLGRPVGEVEDARAKRLRVHELQRLLISSFLKETLPTAQNNRMDHERKLLEEPVGQQRPDEGAAADDPDVLARLPLEPGHFLRDISLDQRRVLPLERLFKGRRDDELGGVVQVVRERLIGAVLVRPVGCELLIGHPSEQHGV